MGSARFSQVRAALRALADPDYRQQIQRLVPGVRAIGVRVPRIRDQVKALVRAERGLDFAGTCALADDLCESGVREEHLFASFLLARFRKQLAELPWTRIARWCETVDNWETCDQLAMNVAAPCLAADLTQVTQLLRWARDANPWRRRFALATAAALNQKGRSHPDLTLRVCAAMVGETDSGVRKALAWALREAGKQDGVLVAAFLREHRQALHPSVLREAARLAPPRPRPRA